MFGSFSPRLILILGALAAFGPMSIDMYLPSLPEIGARLHASSGQVQFTLAIFFVGLAVGQLIYGPLSDRFGRKPLLYVGIGLYSLASLGCALAPNIEALTALRLLQALGGCAGVVLSRAVVRDLFDHQGAARMFSALLLVMGVAPILAPLLGGWVLTHGGWRAIFAVLAVFGVLCLLGVARVLPETRARHNIQPLRLGRALRTYGDLFRDRHYLGHAIATASAMAGMFTYITGSPFVFIQLYGVPAKDFGWLFGLNALGLISLSQINARLISRWPPARLLRWGLRAQALAGALLLALAWIGTRHLALLMVPLFVFVASIGVISPNGTAGALQFEGHRAGSASALMGGCQFGLAFLCSSLLGLIHDGTARPMALIMFGAGSAAFVIHFLLADRPTDGSQGRAGG